MKKEKKREVKKTKKKKCKTSTSNKRKKIDDYDTADDNTKMVDVLLVMTGS